MAERVFVPSVVLRGSNQPCDVRTTTSRVVLVDSGDGDSTSGDGSPFVEPADRAMGPPSKLSLFEQEARDTEAAVVAELHAIRRLLEERARVTLAEAEPSKLSVLEQEALSQDLWEPIPVAQTDEWRSDGRRVIGSRAQRSAPLRRSLRDGLLSVASALVRLADRLRPVPAERRRDGVHE